MFKKILIYILIAIGLLGTVSLLVVLFANNNEEKPTEDDPTEEVTPIEPGEGQLSTFTIDGKTYQYEVGMDWNDWDISNYDSENLLTSAIDVDIVHVGFRNDDTGLLRLCTGNKYVLWNSEIQSLNYVTKEYDGFDTFTIDGAECKYEIGLTFADSRSDAAGTGNLTYVNDSTGTHIGLEGDTTGLLRLYLGDKLVCMYELIQSEDYTFKQYNASEPVEGEVGTFRVDGVDYQYEVGMTWSTWMKSDYNIDDLFSFYTYPMPRVHMFGEVTKQVLLNGAYVTHYDRIQPGANYSTSNCSHS